MKALFKWFIKYKGALYVSGVYGVVAILLYMFGMLSGGDGPIAVWYWVFWSAWPVSKLVIFAVAPLVDLLPDTLGGFLFSASPILAGMLWYYLVSRCVFAIRVKMNVSKQLGI